MLFIGINEQYQARIQVDFDVTCADDCGTTGKISKKIFFSRTQRCFFVLAHKKSVKKP